MSNPNKLFRPLRKLCVAYIDDLNLGQLQDLVAHLQGVHAGWQRFQSGAPRSGEFNSPPSRNPTQPPPVPPDLQRQMRFAVASGDQEITITSLQTSTSMDLPREDLPLLIAALQNLDQTSSQSSPTCHDLSS